MADYKHRATPRRKKKQGNTGLWFFGGFISGAFFMGLVWLKLGPDLAAGRVPGITPPTPQPTENIQKPVPKPEFQFYTILPEMEVVIPDEEILPPKKSKPAVVASVQETDTNAASDTVYILQMGSFRKFVDADRMKARLALIGIEAEIQKVSINNRDTYHRVRSGPYANTSQLKQVRKLAQDNNISTLVIKLKN